LSGAAGWKEISLTLFNNRWYSWYDYTGFEIRYRYISGTIEFYSMKASIDKNHI